MCDALLSFPSCPHTFFPLPLSSLSSISEGTANHQHAHNTYSSNLPNQLASNSFRIKSHIHTHTERERLTMSTMNDTPSSPPPPQQQQHLRQPQQPAKLKVRKRLARLKSTVDKSQQRMFAEHYRVDRSEKVVLPGVPKHDADWARDVHDFFNLIVLVRILYRPTHTFIPYCACGCGMDTLLFLLWSCRH